MKKAFCLLLTISFCLLFCGCSAITDAIDILSGTAAVREAESVVHIGFSNGTLFQDSEEIFLTADELAAYRAPSAQYHSSFLFEQLSDTQQLLYRALEYAMENGYTNVLFDGKLVENDEPLMTVLNYVALDSPFLEQNLRFETGSFTTFFPVTVWGELERSATIEGYYLSVDNFAAEHWQKKEEALQAALQIVAPYAHYNDQLLLADKLYRWVAENVEYRDDYDDDYTVYPYLYDALINRTANCDGFANALSLLYNLAGIPCIEKMYEGQNGEPGHTWNMLCLNDLWYNADSTTDQMIPLEDCSMHAGLYFAFEDQLQEQAPLYETMYPVCEQGLYMDLDQFLPSPQGAADTVLAELAEHDNEWALIAFRQCDEESLRDMLQEIANALQCTIHSQRYPCIADTVVCISDGRLLKGES